MNDTPPRFELTLPRLIAAFIALIVAVGITVAIVDDNGDGRPDRLTVTLGGHDDAPAGVPAGPAELTLDEGGVDSLADVRDSDAAGHEGLDDETPAGVPAAELEAAARQQERLAESNTLPDLTPLAAPFQAGCATRLVGNYSSRNGVRPRVIVAHYTVSRNRPGADDVDAIAAYFNSPSSQASSHYVIDADGNCRYLVRETSKAWTVAAGNPVSLNVEHIAYGDEPDLANAGGYAKSGRVYAAMARRWDIPLQRGAVSNCVVTRPGIVQHYDFGLCGGGHHDVTPFDVGKLVTAARIAGRIYHRRADDRRAHKRYRAADCRRGVHRLRPADLRRAECRDLARRIHRRHRGIARARAGYGEL